MDRQQVKELLPIIQAFAEGKTIQGKLYDGTWVDTKKEDFDNLLRLKEHGKILRVKPEPKYRPFANKEECWNEMLKHQPFAYVKDTSNKAFYSILEVIDDGCVFAYGPVMSFDDVYKYHTFADGTPFGIKE